MREYVQLRSSTCPRSKPAAWGLNYRASTGSDFLEGAVTLMHERASRQDLSLLPDAGKGLG